MSNEKKLQSEVVDSMDKLVMVSMDLAKELMHKERLTPLEVTFIRAVVQFNLSVTLSTMQCTTEQDPKKEWYDEVEFGGANSVGRGPKQ